MPSQWDHRADKDLLLAIIDDGQLKSINWPGIASKMQAKDYTFTHEACRQHFQKIRKESKTNTSSNGNTNSNSDSGYATPSKKKATTNGTSGSTKRKSASKSASFGTKGQEDDEEDFDTPTKKRKALKKEDDFSAQSAPAFKQEKDARLVDLSNDSLYDDSGAEEA